MCVHPRAVGLGLGMFQNILGGALGLLIPLLAPEYFHYQGQNERGARVTQRAGDRGHLGWSRRPGLAQEQASIDGLRWSKEEVFEHRQVMPAVENSILAGVVQCAATP